MLKLFLWLRYLRKKKIVFLSIAAVALAVSLLIVVASLFNGFIDALREASVKTIGDVVLETAPTNMAPIKFAKYPLFIERVEQIGAVEAATATLSAEGLLHLGKGDVRAVRIWGIDAGRRARVTDFKHFLIKQNESGHEPSFEVPGFPDRVGGFLGIGVVTEPDEKDEYDLDGIEEIVGRQVVLTTGTVSRVQGDEGGGVQFKRRVIKFTVADIVFTGVYEFDKSFVYLPIEVLQTELYPGKDGQLADQVQIKLAGDVDVKAALAQIRGVWLDFADKQLNWRPYLASQTTITTAKEMQNQNIVELRKQMRILLFIFGVVNFSVVLLIICIFYMIVKLKQKDIAIIKSCGAASGSVACIFVGFGACVGIIGSGLGIVLGYVITRNINTIEEWIRIIFGLKLWKSSVYMFSEIPNKISWDSVLPIVLLAVVAAAIGALIPAILAARTRPIEILRYE